MTTALLLTDRDGPDLGLGPDDAQRLAELGVSRIHVLSDVDGFGVVLEGWALDPAHIDAAARVLCSGATNTIRVLREVQSASLSTGMPGRESIATGLNEGDA
jgi:hypothetical protein